MEQAPCDLEPATHPAGEAPHDVAPPATQAGPELCRTLGGRLGLGGRGEGPLSPMLDSPHAVERDAPSDSCRAVADRRRAQS